MNREVWIRIEEFLLTKLDREPTSEEITAMYAQIVDQASDQERE